MYCNGLGLREIGRFEDHAGFDGAMLGRAGMHYHFEFTHCRTHPVNPTPTGEDLVVLYVPDEGEWQSICAALLAAGFTETVAFNPYWMRRGKTFEDPDGYRVVLQNDEWNDREREQVAPHLNPAAVRHGSP
jgi:catechol 2,3-dioxygenase-like lactoylglutathione lyase family enzyme